MGCNASRFSVRRQNQAQNFCGEGCEIHCLGMTVIDTSNLCCGFSLQRNYSKSKCTNTRLDASTGTSILGWRHAGKLRGPGAACTRVTSVSLCVCSECPGVTKYHQPTHYCARTNTRPTQISCHTPWTLHLATGYSLSRVLLCVVPVLPVEPASVQL